MLEIGSHLEGDVETLYCGNFLELMGGGWFLLMEDTEAKLGIFYN